MNFSEIEGRARDLQLQIWRERSTLWPGQTLRPLDILDPAMAARILKVKFDYYEELGRFGSGRDQFEIAGMINRQAGKIAVSRKFPSETMCFTGAHEIGHWLLHPGEIMHRDRPIKGITDEKSCRPPQEREADYFAACFLVPRKLAEAAFEATFRTKAPLVLEDLTAFWLCPNDPESLLRADVGSLDFALAVASARSYGGRHINSLSSQFGVSVTTMAIRLRELVLIQE